MTERAPEGDQALLAEPMRSRWSPSIFDDTHVLTADQLRLLLLAAQWAPSCGNAQPAAFVVAERGSASHQVLARHLSRGNSGWVPRASAVLIVGAQLAPDEDGEGGYKPFHAEYDTGPGGGPRHPAGPGDGAARPPVRRVRQGGGGRRARRARRTTS